MDMISAAGGVDINGDAGSTAAPKKDDNSINAESPKRNNAEQLSLF